MTAQATPSRRLAFFAHDLRGGGAERAVVGLVNGMARRGIPLDLVLVRKEGAFLRDLDAGVNLVELPGRRTATSVFGLRRYLESARPAALIAAMTHINAAAVIATRLSRHKARLVLVEHNQFDRNFAQKQGLMRLAYRIAPRLYHRAEVVAGVSRGVRDSIAGVMKVPRDRLSVLYNPVVTPALDTLSREAPDHPWLTDGGAPVLLAVGRLMRSKNYPLLLEAFARLRARRPARLIILGEGALRDELTAQADRLGIASDLDMPGFHANPFAFMRAADLFVMSSDWEGHPTVLVEALACGVPVVSTDCISGPREILDDGRHGHLTPPGDADALARAMAEALDTPGNPAPRIARAYEFDVDTSVDAYLSAAGWPPRDAALAGAAA